MLLSENKSRIIVLLKNFAATFLIIAFASYIGITIWFQYITYKDLNRSLYSQTQKEIEKRAISLNYFFSERKNDLKDIAVNSLVLSYFQNKALGMSLKYGLKSTLFEISSFLEEKLHSKNYRNQRIYDELTFVDSNGKLLADSSHNPYFSRDFSSILQQADYGRNILEYGDFLIFKSPVFFNDKVEGFIMSWVSKKFIEKNFLIPVVQDRRSSLILFTDMGIIASTDSAKKADFSFLKDNLKLFIRLFSDKDFHGNRLKIYKYGDVIVFGSRINYSGFYLMEVVLGKDLNEQRHGLILAAMLVLIFGVFIGLFVWWKLNSINYSLMVELKNKEEREKAVQEKNRELQEEFIKRRAVERTLYEYTKNLKKIIKIKTAHLEKALHKLKLAQSKLIQSEKLASIGQLSAGIAHEINNPIGFIKTNIKTLGDYVADIMMLVDKYDSLDREFTAEDIVALLKSVEEIKGEIDFDYIKGDIKSIFSETEDGIERILSIVKDLKFFAHQDQSSMEVVDIHMCIESTLNIIHNEIKYKADVEKRFGTLPEIKGFPQRVNQILTNLLVNAAQSIEDRGTITIETYTEDDFAVIKISDTGAGIPREIRDKIFDPFFSTKPVGKGTGLGLHVVYNLVKMHKGKLKVRSKPGEGTSFFVFLPL